jgi:SHS2 domain-containing protein
MNAAIAQHQFLAHTGEVRLEVAAPTRAELFAQAGRALAELMLGEEGSVEPVGPEQAIELTSGDAASLLVDWLNELIFLGETHKRVFTRFGMDQVDERSLRARASGHTPKVLETAVKAATLHQVRLAEVGGGFRASVVLDV